MLKLFQMLEFLTLFNVNYPTNVKVFLSQFSLGNPIKNIPNPFKNFYNEHCSPSEVEFVGDDISCQILDNSGPLLAVICGTIITKIFLVAIIAVLKAAKSTKIKDKLQKVSTKMTSVENIFEFISGTHLDIYLSMTSNFLRYKSGDKIADLNVFVSMVVLLFLLYALVFFLFITSKVLEAERTRRTSLQKMYKKYMYLTSDLDTRYTFGAYYKILNVIKDPIIAFSIVLLYSNPML